MLPMSFGRRWVLGVLIAAVFTLRVLLTVAPLRLHSCGLCMLTARSLSAVISDSPVCCFLWHLLFRASLSEQSIDKPTMRCTFAVQLCICSYIDLRVNVGVRDRLNTSGVMGNHFTVNSLSLFWSFAWCASHDAARQIGNRYASNKKTLCQCVDPLCHSLTNGGVQWSQTNPGSMSKHSWVTAPQKKGHSCGGQSDNSCLCFSFPSSSLRWIYLHTRLLCAFAA